MKKVFAVFVCSVLAITQVQAKVVRMGTEGAYPPFNFLDGSGELAGFDIEIGDALCQAAELECEWVTQDWDGIIPGLLAEKYDAIIASMTINDERRQKVDFTGKYYVSPARFVGRAGRALDGDGKLLKDTVIGVQSATIMENFALDKFGQTNKVKSYDTQESANLDLVAGRLDWVFGEVFVMSEFLQSDAGAKYAFAGPTYSDPKWFGEGIGIAVRKGDDKLREQLNRAIAKIRADSTYGKISDKYFGLDVYGD